MSTSFAIELALAHVLGFSGDPYIWGGDDPIKGFDCSGLAVEYLKVFDTLNEWEDYTAQGLADLLEPTEVIARGNLSFYGTSIKKITHVEIIIGPVTSLGASGGGRRVKTREDAIRENAYIRPRPVIKTWAKLVAVRLPKKRMQ